MVILSQAKRPKTSVPKTSEPNRTVVRVAFVANAFIEQAILRDKTSANRQCRNAKLAPGEQLPPDSETDDLESWKNASQSQTSANGQQKLMPGLGRNNVANKKAKESSERTPMRVSERPPPHVKMKASCLQQE